MIFLAHPLGANSKTGVQENLQRAMLWYRWACDTYWPMAMFEATWMLNCLVYNDADGEQRRRGIERNFGVLMRCDALWLVGGRVSAGMREEAVFTTALGKPIFDLTHLGDEPPGKDSPYPAEMTPVDPQRFTTVA